MYHTSTVLSFSAVLGVGANCFIPVLKSVTGKASSTSDGKNVEKEEEEGSRIKRRRKRKGKKH